MQQPEQPAGLGAVFLTRQELIRISPDQLDERIAGLRKRSGSFTEAERTEIARQRKLVRNREASRHFRQTRKQYVETLEEENAVLRYRLALVELQLVWEQQRVPCQMDEAAPSPPVPTSEAPQPLCMETLFSDESETLSL